MVVSLAIGLIGCSNPAVDRSHYFRMKVGLTYKNKPVDIDFVAGCNVHIGRDLSGGSIDEISGMTDLFRGVRMPEGHAVVINSYPLFEGPRFNPCDGDTTNGPSISKNIDTRVPKDWLPFIVWFERDDQFAHGVGYMTQDAYENKNARFGFRYARIERATKAEFDAFRKSGPANLLPPHQTGWMTGGPKDPSYLHVKDVPENVRRNPASGWWKTDGRDCQGAVRRPLTDEERIAVHNAWPKDHPDYWRDPQLFKTVDSLGWTGIGLTHFGVRLSGDRVRDVFPITSNQTLSRLTPTTPPTQELDVLIGDGVANLGEVDCDIFNSSIADAVTGQSTNRDCIGLIDGSPMQWPLSDCELLSLKPFLYRDKYVIRVIHEFRS